MACQFVLRPVSQNQKLMASPDKSEAQPVPTPGRMSTPDSADNPSGNPIVPFDSMSEAAREAVIANAVYAVQRDFLALARTIDRVIAYAATSDEELLARLRNAQSLAKRGAIISKQVITLSRKRRAID